MKIAVLLGSYTDSSGGSNTYVDLISRTLANKSQSSEIEYFYYSGLRLISSGQIDNLENKNHNYFKKLFKSKDRLKKLLLKSFFKHIIVVTLYRKIYASLFNRILKFKEIDFAWSLYPLTFPLKIPFATTVWDLQHLTQPYWPEFTSANSWYIRDIAYQKVLPRASLIISGTQFGSKQISKYYRVESERIIVVPFPITRKVPSYSNSRLENVFFYPAQFWPHKNHFNLILGFVLASRSTNKNFKLLLPGSDKGNLNHIKNLVKQHKVEENVLFPGFITKNELDELYRTATGLIYPSYFGPDNFPPLESIAFECPVAIAKLPGVDVSIDLFDYYFDPDSPKDICDAFIKLSHCAKSKDTNKNLLRDTILKERSPEFLVSGIEKQILNLNSRFKNWEK